MNFAFTGVLDKVNGLNLTGGPSHSPSGDDVKVHPECSRPVEPHSAIDLEEVEM